MQSVFESGIAAADSMLRTVFFTTYGICVGVGYAFAIWMLAADEPIAATFWSVLVIIFFGGQGWGIGANSECSNFQGWAWITFTPIYLAYGCAAIAVFMLFILPYFLLSAAIDHAKREHHLRGLLADQGRIIGLADLQGRLEAGEGTLLYEAAFKGPRRIWWTADDVFSLGALPSTDEEVVKILTGELIHAFNDECAKRYLAAADGKALLVSISARVPLRKLAGKFPKMRIAEIVNVGSTGV